ncbi:hypothetical protein C8Q74DRAFT_1222727 [Fomes fomentarius]|nr:hypothetical protein C8Q74DRAFT_1222727 [Fomes fomentarius]
MPDMSTVIVATDAFPMLSAERERMDQTLVQLESSVCSVLQPTGFPVDQLQNWPPSTLNVFLQLNRKYCHLTQLEIKQGGWRICFTNSIEATLEEKYDGNVNCLTELDRMSFTRAIRRSIDGILSYKGYLEDSREVVYQAAGEEHETLETQDARLYAELINELLTRRSMSCDEFNPKFREYQQVTAALMRQIAPPQDAAIAELQSLSFSATLLPKMSSLRSRHHLLVYPSDFSDINGAKNGDVEARSRKCDVTPFTLMPDEPKWLQLDLTAERLSAAETQLIEQNADSKTQMRRLCRYKETTLESACTELQIERNRLETQEQENAAMTCQLEGGVRYLESENASLQTEVDLYRGRCNELALQLENSEFNNLEYEMGDTIERVEAENREKDSDILALQRSLKHTSNPAMGAISETSPIDTSTTVIASGDVATVLGVNTLQGGTVHSKGLAGLIEAASHPSERTTMPKHKRVFGAAHHSKHPLRDVQGIPADKETPSAPPDTHSRYRSSSIDLLPADIHINHYSIDLIAQAVITALLSRDALRLQEVVYANTLRTICASSSQTFDNRARTCRFGQLVHEVLFDNEIVEAAGDMHSGSHSTALHSLYLAYKCASWTPSSTIYDGPLWTKIGCLMHSLVFLQDPLGKRGIPVWALAMCLHSHLGILGNPQDSQGFPRIASATQYKPSVRAIGIGKVLVRNPWDSHFAISNCLGNPWDSQGFPRIPKDDDVLLLSLPQLSTYAVSVGIHGTIILQSLHLFLNKTSNLQYCCFRDDHHARVFTVEIFTLYTQELSAAPTATFINHTYQAAAMSSAGVPSPNPPMVSSSMPPSSSSLSSMPVMSMSSSPMPPSSTMSSSTPSSLMPNPFTMSSQPMLLLPISPMGIPLSQVNLITALRQPMATGLNVSQQQAARANTIKVTHGSLPSYVAAAGASSAAGLIITETKLDTAIIPLSCSLPPPPSAEQAAVSSGSFHALPWILMGPQTVCSGQGAFLIKYASKIHGHKLMIDKALKLSQSSSKQKYCSSGYWQVSHSFPSPEESVKVPRINPAACPVLAPLSLSSLGPSGSGLTPELHGLALGQSATSSPASGLAPPTNELLFLMDDADLQLSTSEDDGLPPIHTILEAALARTTVSQTDRETLFPKYHLVTPQDELHQSVEVLVSSPPSSGAVVQSLPAMTMNRPSPTTPRPNVSSHHFMPTHTASHPSTKHASSVLPIGIVPMSGLVAQWHTKFKDAHTDQEVLSFFGNTIAILTDAFVAYLVHINMHLIPWARPDWTCPSGVSTFSQFRTVHKLLSVHARYFSVRSLSTGNAIERAVLIQAVRTMASHAAFWVRRGEYHEGLFLNDVMMNPARIATWKAYGNLCAIFLVAVGVALKPVSPFLLLIALLGVQTRSMDSKTESMPLTDLFAPITQLPVLAAFDPALARQFKPWFDLAWDAPLPNNSLHPACQFVIMVMEQNLAQVTSLRTSATSPDTHAAWLSHALLKVLFATFILGWYDCHIANAQNFIDNRISYFFTKKKSRKGKEQDTGMPDDGSEKKQRISTCSVMAIPTIPYYTRQCAATRVVTLLHVITDSDMLPVDPGWQIIVEVCTSVIGSHSPRGLSPIEISSDHGSPNQSSSKSSSSDFSEEDKVTPASQYAALTGLEPTQEMAIEEIRNQSSPSGDASESNPEFGTGPSFYLTSPYATQYSPLPAFRESRNDTTAGLAPSGVRRTDSLGLVDMPTTGGGGQVIECGSALKGGGGRGDSAKGGLGVGEEGSRSYWAMDEFQRWVEEDWWMGGDGRREPAE